MSNSPIWLLLTIFLFAASSIACGVAATQWQNARSAQSEIESLKSALAREKGNASLRNKLECAKASKKEFSELGYDHSGMDDFKNHYSNKYQFCIMELITHNNSSGKWFENHFLFDVYENGDLGQFIFVSESTKKFWEVVPKSCEIHFPGEAARQCSSRAEWDGVMRELFAS